MRFSRALLFLVLIVIAVALFWPTHGSHSGSSATKTIPDLSMTKPLNQPGGGTVPPEAYEIYSDLYQTPTQEPLVFAENSVTDIPQVNGSCLKPSTPEEQEMAEAFEDANRQSQVWERKFALSEQYQLLSREETSAAQTCMETHGQDTAQCDRYKQVRHVRFLGVPGLDRARSRALVSVIKMCGQFCGSGGIFAVEKSGGRWRRSDTTDFTRDCSWMY